MARFPSEFDQSVLNQIIAEVLDNINMSLNFQDQALDKDIIDPSTLTPSDGDRYIVGNSAIGLWASHDYEIAQWFDVDSSWHFYTPEDGWVIWVADEHRLYVYSISLGYWVTFASVITPNTSFGTTPPSSPSDGDIWTDSDTMITYIFNGNYVNAPVNGIWVSGQRTTYLFGRLVADGNLGVYLYHSDFLVSSDTGILIPRPALITGITLRNANTVSRNLRIIKNGLYSGTPIDTLILSSEKQNKKDISDYSKKVDENDRLQLYLQPSTGNTMQRIIATVEMQWYILGV